MPPCRFLVWPSLVWSLYVDAATPCLNILRRTTCSAVKHRTVPRDIANNVRVQFLLAEYIGGNTQSSAIHDPRE